MITPIPTLYEIDKIIKTLQYQPNDFKFFFKIWPVINNDTELKKQCESLDYEKEMYKKLRNDKIKLSGQNYINHNDKYILTPILSESNGFKLIDLSKLLGITTQKEYDIFVYVFYTWLSDPSQPNTDYIYKENFDDILYNDTVKQDIIQIENKLTFKYIMTPVIPNTRTFGYVMDIVRNNQTQTLNILMKNFCNIFVNIIEGIKTLKVSHVNHNDLHDNNIFVTQLNNGINTFIYDYDRSFCKKLGNNHMLNDNICSGTCQFSQCNIYDYWLDFFKILHYVFRGNSREFNILLLFIITTRQTISLDGSVKDQYILLFSNFIIMITHNQFLHYPNKTCSWYFDTDSNEHTILRENIKHLLVDYQTIIENIKNWLSQHQDGEFNINNQDDNLLLGSKELKNNDSRTSVFEQTMRDNELLRNKFY